MRWFRFYAEVVDDPKAQRLPADLFRSWVNLLCMACVNGGFIPPMADVAFKLRMSVAKATKQVSALVTAGLLDEKEGTLRPHNWNGRQFESDDSSNRVKEFRKRKRNVTPTVTETPPDTEADTDTELEKKSVSEILKEVNGSLRAKRRGPDYSDPSVRKARWEQKIMTEINSTMPPADAQSLIAAYMASEPWAVAQFNAISDQLKAMKEKLARSA